MSSKRFKDKKQSAGPSVTQAGILWEKVELRLETQRGRHHEKFIKALNGSCRPARVFSRYLSYFWAAFPCIIHTNRGENRIQAIKLTQGLLKFAEMSNSLGAGELKSHPRSLQQASQMRAQWTPHTSLHGR